MEEKEVFLEKFLCESIFQFLNGLTTLEKGMLFLFLFIIIIYLLYLLFKAYKIEKDTSSKEAAMNIFIEKIEEKDNEIKKLNLKIKKLENKIEELVNITRN